MDVIFTLEIFEGLLAAVRQEPFIATKENEFKKDGIFVRNNREFVVFKNKLGVRFIKVKSLYLALDLVKRQIGITKFRERQ